MVSCVVLHAYALAAAAAGDAEIAVSLFGVMRRLYGTACTKDAH
jgi:hypothetical protein